MGDDEPYNFTSENFMESCNTSCAELTCIVCFIQINVKWYNETPTE